MPELPRHHRADGGFRNPWPAGTPSGLGGLWKWWWQRAVHPPPPGIDPGSLPKATPAFIVPRAPANRVTLTWVGHATFLVQIGGCNVLTDPVWSSRVSPFRFAGPRRLVPPGVPLEALPPIDLVLQSHNHYDHLDDATVRALVRAHPEAAWLAPLGVGEFLRRRGAAYVGERDWWDGWERGALACTAVPAQHFSARSPLDRDATLWCGWAVAGAGRRVLFAGDTGYHPEFAAIGTRAGPFDAVLLPIGAYEPRWFMRPVHMNPEEAVHAYRDVGREPAAPLFVAMHWGTIRLTDEPLDEPPRRLRAAWAQGGLPADRLWIPAHGETRIL